MNDITIYNRSIKPGEHVLEVRTRFVDHSRGGSFLQFNFRLEQISSGWMVEPLEHGIWGENRWYYDTVPEAIEGTRNMILGFVTLDEEGFRHLEFSRNSGGYFTFSGEVKEQGRVYYVYAARKPNEPFQWQASASVKSERRLIEMDQGVFAGEAILKAMERIRRLVGVVKPVEARLKGEIPEDLQKAIGFLQRMSEKLEASDWSQNVGLFALECAFIGSVIEFATRYERQEEIEDKYAVRSDVEGKG